MHLNEKLAEYVYEELPAAEMAEARRHVAGCAECGDRVKDFERIHHALKAMPDVDLPRRVVIEPAKAARVRTFLPVRWLAPVGAAVALVLALAVVGPIHAEWHDSQITIAFGKMPSSNVAQAPAIAPQPVDYKRLAEEVRAQNAAYLQEELVRLEQKVAVSSGRQLAEVRSQIVYLKNQQEEQQRDFRNKTEDINKSFQMVYDKAGN
jgi:putative zinc finger protein